MFLVGHNKELFMVASKPDKNGKNSGYYTAVCFGSKRHYRKDGSCIHTEGLFEAAQPRFRKRIKIAPFGGKAQVAEE